MKRLVAVLVTGITATIWAGAQEGTRPPMRAGIAVQMANASHAVEVRGADAEGSVVLAITADGKLFNGIEAVEAASLAKVTARTVYLKADARAPFQTVLAAMDALQGKSVVLIAASPTGASNRQYRPPFGIRVNLPR